MAMFPVFMIGVIVGFALAYAWFMYKKETPSQIKLETQEYTINSQKNDIELLTKLNEKLYAEINDLKKQLNIK